MSEFCCSHVGVTTGEVLARETSPGAWVASCPIGTLFGQEVEGQLVGTGATREEALTALEVEKEKLADSLWA